MVRDQPDPPDARGCSSAGRAPALQAGGRRFEPDQLHQQRALGRLRKRKCFLSLSRQSSLTNRKAKVKKRIGRKADVRVIAFATTSARSVREPATGRVRTRYLMHDGCNVIGSST